MTGSAKLGYDKGENGRFHQAGVSSSFLLTCQQRRSLHKLNDLVVNIQRHQEEHKHQYQPNRNKLWFAFAFHGDYWWELFAIALMLCCSQLAGPSDGFCTSMPDASATHKRFVGPASTTSSRRRALFKAWMVPPNNRLLLLALFL